MRVLQHSGNRFDQIRDAHRLIEDECVDFFQKVADTRVAAVASDKEKPVAQPGFHLFHRR